MAKFTKEELMLLYEKYKFSTGEIAKTHGCHKDTVLYYLKKYEIPRRKRKITIRNCQKEFFKRLYLDEKKSTRDIAKLLNLDHTTIGYWLKKCGIETRCKSETMKRIWKLKPHPHLGMTGEKSYMYGRKLSETTKIKIGNAVRGEKNYNWKGGRFQHSTGYIVMKDPKHPNADPNGYVLEHRKVMERILGRYLDSHEIVHHINGDKTDNRPENLMLFNSRRDHVKYHEYFNERKDA